MNGRCWTPEEDAKLLDLRQKGKTIANCAMILKRDVTNVGYRCEKLANLVIVKSTTESRHCLWCHNRLIPRHRGDWFHEECRRASYRADF